MGKMENNPMMSTGSGMVGKTIVFKQWYGKQIYANRPKKTKKPTTPAQIKVQEKFTVAANYAKHVLSASGDPATKALYEAGVGGNKHTARSVAMGDYLNAPKVRSIDATGYKGLAGDKIKIDALDDFKVVKVTVVVTGASGTVIESGDAVQDLLNPVLWLYTMTTANAAVKGTTIQATAFDIPDNNGVLSLVM